MLCFSFLIMSQTCWSLISVVLTSVDFDEEELELLWEAMWFGLSEFGGSVFELAVPCHQKILHHFNSRDTSVGHVG
ncbi:hypothetical protein Hanom_Chr06g00525651 [Helianthus anomalus]